MTESKPRTEGRTKLSLLGRVSIHILATLLASSYSIGAESAIISPVKLDENTTAIFVLGDIELNDGSKFRSVAEKYDHAIVLLESDGGSLAAAIEMGEAIRLKGYSTAVINNSSCNSSCALIWLAGAPRKLSKSGRVGFHAAYAEVEGEAKESGVGNAMIGRYLTLLNLPEEAVLFATASPPTSLNWLTASNYKSTGIETTIIDDIPLDSTAAQSQSTIPSKIWLQLASGADREGLLAQFARLRERDPQLFNGIHGYVAQGQDRARLLIGPFRTADDCETFAQDLKSVGINALMWTNSTSDEIVAVGTNKP